MYVCVCMYVSVCIQAHACMGAYVHACGQSVEERVQCEQAIIYSGSGELLTTTQETIGWWKEYLKALLILRGGGR